MKWQGRTGLAVGLALVVAAGLVVPGKNVAIPEPLEPLESPVATTKKIEPRGAVPVSRPAREPVPAAINH